MKPQIAYRDSTSQRHTKGLDPAIQVLVIDGVFIMPNAGGWISYLVGNEPAAIDSGFGFDRINSRTGPGIDGGCRPNGGSNGREGETRRAGHIETTVGRIVVHVALPSVGLAPGVLMRSDVLRFRVIRCPWIQCRVQVISFHEKPVRSR
jgi:hypothetical protein